METDGMSEPKCPMCGTAQYLPEQCEWVCGTYFPRKNGILQEIEQGAECLKTQLAAAQARIAEVEDTLAVRIAQDDELLETYSRLACETAQLWQAARAAAGLLEAIGEGPISEVTVIDALRSGEPMLDVPALIARLRGEKSDVPTR